MRAIEILGRETCPIEEREKAGPRHLLFAHLFESVMALVLAHDGIVLTTRRAEQDIRASWVRRGKDTAELERQLANYRILIEQRRPYVLELGAWR